MHEINLPCSESLSILGVLKNCEKLTMGNAIGGGRGGGADSGVGFGGRHGRIFQKPATDEELFQ
jgi:hypothetical protein